MNLGFAAHLGAASALYLYFLIHRRSGSIPRFEVVLHLLPPIAITLASPWLHLQSFWYLGGYHCLLIASVIYWAWAVKLFFDIRRERVQVFQQKSSGGLVFWPVPVFSFWPIFPIMSWGFYHMPRPHFSTLLPFLAWAIQPGAILRISTPQTSHNHRKNTGTCLLPKPKWSRER
ncbi:MAG: hypothetical protein R2824_17260 [Saprospiraceae bacterium]